MSGAAVIIGASGGIGGAFRTLLEEEGAFAPVHGFARSFTGANHIDLLDEASIAAAAAHVARGPAPALIFVATGLLHEGDRGPEKALRDVDPDWLARSYAVNAIGPLLVAKHFLPLMPRSGRTVFAALSARVGSISDNRLGGWHGYRASKAALNMLVRNFAIELARTHREASVVALHPGTVDTGLSEPFQANLPSGQLTAPPEAAHHLLNVIDKLTPAESGKAFDWKGEEIPS